jgi:RNA polymerase sigma-70 factor, ECF subfamily
MPELSDRELVEKAAAGDTQAFRLLVEKHQSFVYAVAYRIVTSVADAEDITQEAFIRLWKNLKRYRPEIKITTWLYKIVTNLSLDFLKSAHGKHSKRMDNVDHHTRVAGEGASDQPMLDEELRIAVEKIANDLTPKQKAVFVLRDIEDLRTEEICEILSMSSGTVKTNLYYARKRIGELLSVFYQIKKPVKP